MMMTSQHDGLCVDKALAVAADAVAISNQENSATQKNGLVFKTICLKAPLADKAALRRPPSLHAFVVCQSVVKKSFEHKVCTTLSNKSDHYWTTASFGGKLTHKCHVIGGFI